MPTINSSGAEKVFTGNEAIQYAEKVGIKDTTGLIAVVKEGVFRAYLIFPGAQGAEYITVNLQDNSRSTKRSMTPQLGSKGLSISATAWAIVGSGLSISDPQLESV